MISSRMPGISRNAPGFLLTLKLGSFDAKSSTSKSERDEDLRLVSHRNGNRNRSSNDDNEDDNEGRRPPFFTLQLFTFQFLSLQRRARAVARA